MLDALSWQQVVFTGDPLFLQGTGSALIQEYAAAWGVAGFPKEARVFTPAGLDKATSNVWIYFFSPKAAEIAKHMLQKPSLKVEACQEPDLSSLKEVRV
jgi:hypothetical protein